MIVSDRKLHKSYTMTMKQIMHGLRRYKDDKMKVTVVKRMRIKTLDYELPWMTKNIGVSQARSGIS